MDECSKAGGLSLAFVDVGAVCSRSPTCRRETLEVGHCSQSTDRSPPRKNVDVLDEAEAAKKPQLRAKDSSSTASC